MLSPGHNFPDGWLDAVESVMALEEAFDIGIADEDAEKTRIWQDTIDYIRRKKGNLN